MVPGPPFLSLVMAWAADYDPSKPANMDTPLHQAEGGPAFSPRADPDSDSELTQSPFDLCLARYAQLPTWSMTAVLLHALGCKQSPKSCQYGATYIQCWKQPVSLLYAQIKPQSELAPAFM